MAHICLKSMAIVTILVVSHGVSAKRGCSAFGHSCFGGHGKRSSDTAGFEVRNPETMSARRQAGQEETPPHAVYPNSGLNGILQPGDDIIPIRDGGALEHEENGAIRQIMKLRLRNIIKHWMENYRRGQQNSDDGYFVDTL